MKVGEIHTITLGKYGDKYKVVNVFITSVELVRIRMPKSKIDAIRLPARISITYFGTQLPIKNKNQ
jgi:hypothetical protein